MEWSALEHGKADLQLVVGPPGLPKYKCDTVKFHTFESIVLGIGGRNQAPFDGNADDNEGTFDLVMALYNGGYDAYALHENTVPAALDLIAPHVAYDEVVEAIENRCVTNVAILGYSHGGGSAYLLAKRLNNKKDDIEGTFALKFTAYIDAVKKIQGYSSWAEDKLPPETEYHMNYYQEGSLADTFLDGTPIREEDREKAELFEVNVDSPTKVHTHYTIDDDVAILSAVGQELTKKVPR